MGLLRFGSQDWSRMKAGMVIYSVAHPWGHAMLIEPAGEGLDPKRDGTLARVQVFHMAPPLTQNDSKSLDASCYLGFCETSGDIDDMILKDVCAAMKLMKAEATASPQLGLLENPGCYSIAPSGILTAIAANASGKSTSCSGLVEECYRHSGMTLVHDESLPEMSFAELREYVERHMPRLSRLNDRRLCKRLGIAKEARVRPLFTSYQMRAFEENRYPYQVLANDPKDVSRWQ